MAPLMLSGFAQAETLTYNFVQLPPLQYQPNEQTEATGVAIDLVRAAATEIALPLKFQQLPPRRMLKTLSTGQLQLALVSSAYIAPWRHLYHCSAAPLSQLRPTLYVNAQLHPNIARLTDLNEEVVYTPRATSDSLYPLLPTTIRQDDSNSGAVVSRLYSAGRLGLVVDFREHMQSTLAQAPPTFAQHTIELEALNVVLCINRQIDEYQQIHHRLQNAALRIAHSPRGQAIFQQHELLLEFIAESTSETGSEIHAEGALEQPRT